MGITGRVFEVNGTKYKVILDNEGDHRYVPLRKEEEEVVSHHPEAVAAKQEVTIINTPEDQLKFIDEAISQWKVFKSEAETEEERIISDATLETYQTIRLTFFGEIKS